MTYDIEMEPFARTYFEQLFQVHVELCELFIDREYPFLPASPGNTIIQINNYAGIYIYSKLHRYIYTMYIHCIVYTVLIITMYLLFSIQ